MIPLLHKFPVDWTGESLHNRTKSEVHDMDKIYNLAFRCVVLDHGYFYTDKLVIIDEQGKELRPDLDFQLISFNDEVFSKTGKVACAVIVIVNPKISSKIYVDAQMVGGSFERVGKAIAQMSMGLLNNTRKVHWNNVTGKPDRFPAGGHTHPLWELYGFTPSVVQFKRMAEAAGKSTAKVLDGIYRDYDEQMTLLERDLSAIEQLLTTHIADLANPHDDTAFKIGLGDVLNAPTATETQARQPHGNLMSIYATPWSVGLAYDANFTPIVQAHITNKNNPHGLTAAQLSVYTVAEFNDRARLYVDLGATMEKSALAFGYTADTMQPVIQLNNDINNLNQAMFPFKVWAQPYLTTVPVSSQCFTASGYWYSIAAALGQYMTGQTDIYTISGDQSTANAIAVANTYYGGAKTGSLLFYHVITQGASFTGNGSVLYNNVRSTMMLTKHANQGWLSANSPT